MFLWSILARPVPVPGRRGWLWIGWAACLALALADAALMLAADPRLAAEMAGGLALGWALLRARAGARAEREARAAYAELVTRVDEEVGARVEADTADLTARVNDLDSEVCTARLTAKRAVERMDLTGQFVAVAGQWYAAVRSKKPAPVSGKTVLDERYWWGQLRDVARARWPGVDGTDDELLAAARAAAAGLDRATWRLLANSEYGLTLEVTRG